MQYPQSAQYQGFTKSELFQLVRSKKLNIVELQRRMNVGRNRLISIFKNNGCISVNELLLLAGCLDVSYSELIKIIIGRDLREYKTAGHLAKVAKWHEQEQTYNIGALPKLGTAGDAEDIAALVRK